MKIEANNYTIAVLGSGTLGQGIAQLRERLDIQCCFKTSLRNKHKVQLKTLP